MRLTKKDRVAAVTQLGQLSRQWIAMSDVQLLSSLRERFPHITSATRDECLRTLILDYVWRAFDA